MNRNLKNDLYLLTEMLHLFQFYTSTGPKLMIPELLVSWFIFMHLFSLRIPLTS